MSEKSPLFKQQRDERDKENIEIARVNEFLLAAQSAAQNNLLSSLDRKGRAIVHLDAAAPLLAKYATELAEYVNSDADEEVEYEDQSDKEFKQRTVKGKLRFKDRRLNNYLKLVERYERIAHNIGTAPDLPTVKKAEFNLTTGDIHNYMGNAGQDFDDFRKAKAADATQSQES